MAVFEILRLFMYHCVVKSIVCMVASIRGQNLVIFPGPFAHCLRTVWRRPMQKCRSKRCRFSACIPIWKWTELGGSCDILDDIWKNLPWWHPSLAFPLLYVFWPTAVVGYGALWSSSDCSRATYHNDCFWYFLSKKY